MGKILEDLRDRHDKDEDVTGVVVTEPVVWSLGDSQVQRVNPQKISGIKVSAYNLDECVAKVKAECIRKMKTLIAEVRKKSNNAKIVVSGPVPDLQGNGREVMVFNRMKRELNNVDQNLVFLNNHNKFVKPNENLYWNPAHPSVQGVKVLAYNIRQACVKY